jgi:hypothetical protein
MSLSCLCIESEGVLFIDKELKGITAPSISIVVRLNASHY